MANKKKDMSKIRQMLRLYSQGESKLKISKLTGVSRNTLKKYIGIYRCIGLSMNDLEKKSDHELNELFEEDVQVPPCARYNTLKDFFPTMEKELKKRGVTRHQLWLDYIADNRDGYKLSQFKHHYHQWLQRSKPVMHIVHIAGDKMYIDYTGEKLHIVSKETGEIVDLEVFIAILGASQLTYVEATLSQKKEDFISACEHALIYFGGVPRAIVPDNLKSAVIKSDRYEPTLNQAFENFASHYSTAVLPARAYKPKDKALVEGAVKIIYRRIFSILDQKVYYTLEEINAVIKELLEKHNNTTLSCRPYSRRSMFEDIERSALQALPSFPYEFKRQQTATIAVNGHVCLSEDKHYYSLPHVLIGQKVTILYTSTQVEFFQQYKSIALYPRNRIAYGYTTVTEHLASTHKYLSEWNPERFISWAQSIDPSVKDFITQLMDSKSHPEQAYKACQGVLGYERKVGRERLVDACKRAIQYGSYSYNTIKTILENNYDKLEITDKTSDIPKHNNIRGENYYH